MGRNGSISFGYRNKGRSIRRIAIPAGILLLFLLSSLSGISSGVDSAGRGIPPGRGGDLEMDMSISEASLASFIGENLGDDAWSVSKAGDVNGDSYNDFLIGAYNNDEGSYCAGQTYLIFGKESGWSKDTSLGLSDASFIGESSEDCSGWSFSGAGDVNGDGFDDILIGAVGNDEGGDSNGQTYLIFGKENGWSMDTSLSSSDASFIGESNNDFAGHSVSGARDVNGDGFDDILIGSSGNSEMSGQTYLIFGKESGWSMDTPLSSSDASFIGELNGDASGSIVSGIGDVNGDGYDDFLIGAWQNDEGGGNSGQTYLIFGKENGWVMDTSLSASDASFIGEASSDASGHSLSDAGDINGDGYNDFLIGAYTNGEGGHNAGQTYLFFGKENGWSMDISLSTSDASFIGEADADLAGVSLSCGGDINGDGFDDILVGAMHNNDGGNTAGQTYIIFGKGDEWSNDTSLSSSDASVIGETYNDHSGRSVSTVGDVNGDGLDDILIESPNNVGRGKTYLISGSGYSEPLMVYDILVMNDMGYKTTISDILDHLTIEMTGLDSNATHVDRARVNITFSDSKPSQFRISLLETGENTGIYRGSYIIPSRSIYFEKIRFSAYIDQTKYQDLNLDYPFRPKIINSVGTFKDDSCTIISEKADFFDSLTVQAKGIDANNLKTDKAFVNITSDKNSTLYQMLILTETGIATGIYRGSFTIPSTMQWFENITLTSVEDPSKTARFMIHTPVQIRSLDYSPLAMEDQEYKVTFFNFGYDDEATWSMNTGAYWLSWDVAKRTLSGIPNNTVVGKWVAWIDLADTEGHSSEFQVDITVENRLPTILTQNVLSVKEADHYLVDYDSDDDGQGNVSWYITTDATWLTLDKNSGILEGTPANDDVGTKEILIAICDGNDGWNRTKFNLTVTNINQKPRILTDDITSVDQGSPYQRDYDLTDPDTEDTHVWSVTSDALWLTMVPSTGILSGDVPTNALGIFNVNVTVTDSGGMIDSREFDLTVKDVEFKPAFIDVPPKELEIYNGYEYRFDINATDYDGDQVSYSVSTSPDSDLNLNLDTGVITWTAKLRSLPKGVDFLSVTISASDGKLTNTYVFKIKVLATGSPTVTLLSPSHKSRASSQFTVLSWEGIDPENEDVFSTVFLSDAESMVLGLRPECCVIENSELSKFNATDLKPGTIYYWTVIPNDGGMDGSCTNGIFSFKVNNPPRITVSLKDLTASTGNEFKLELLTADDDPEDDLNLKITLGGHPEGMTLDEKGNLKWTPESTGQRSVTLFLSDGVETVSYSFDIKVGEGKAGSSLIVPIFMGIVLLIIVIGTVLFFVLRKKKSEKDVEAVTDESAKIIAEMEAHKLGEETMGLHAPSVVQTAVPMSVAEAHANLGKDRPKTYEEMYGTPAPKEEAPLSKAELKEEIGRMADQLENELAE